MAVEQIDRMDAATLIERVCAVVRSARPSPDAVFVLGSEDSEELVEALQEETDRPVVTATEADFAMTRGAALASALLASSPRLSPPSRGSPGFSCWPRHWVWRAWRS